MKALVLCAGFGTRLGPLTRELPKALLPLEGEPLLAYTLALLARHGVTDIAINLHFGADAIRRFVGARPITFHEESSLLGTAGTVRALASFFGDDDALVLYGDLLLDVDLRAMMDAHRAMKADATLMVHRRARSNSVVELDEQRRVTRFLERPTDPRATEQESWVNSGVAILSRVVRDRIPLAPPSDLPRDVYAPHCESLRLYGFPLAGERIAIDSPARYELACQAVREGRVSRG